jgi:hypothetical protein
MRIQLRMHKCFAVKLLLSYVRADFFYIKTAHKGMDVPNLIASMEERNWIVKVI